MVQPSPLVLLPSSQPSPGSSTLLPHTFEGSHTLGEEVESHRLDAQSVFVEHSAPFSSKHVIVQPSPGVTFPSSQASFGSRRPFPHTSNDSQTDDACVASHLPDAQSASNAHDDPSSTRHEELQPSLSTLLPSSQASPDSSTPFPHVSGASQTEVACVVSHSVETQSSFKVHGEPSSMRQEELQPSPLVSFPSSQASPDSTTLLPHIIALVHVCVWVLQIWPVCVQSAEV